MIACHPSKGSASEGYWRWRVVDGRTCWHVAEVRVGKSQLTWGQTKTPEIVVARKYYTEAQLLLPAPPVTKPEPVIWDENQLNPLDQALLDSEQTPQQRIDGAFEAIGMPRKQPSWIDPYTVDRPLASPASAAVPVAASSEDGAATVPLRDAREIALALGVIVIALLLWRGVTAAFGTIGRAQ